MGFAELGVVIAAVLLWLVAVCVVLYRGFILPAVRTDDFKFAVAEERRLFSAAGIERERAPAAEEEMRRRIVDEALGARADSEGESQRYVVWKAWRNDPAFKAEVRRRYGEHYPRHHAEIALLCGGIWSLVFVLAEPLQEALVPDGFSVLFPVYLLVAPLWIAVVLMAVFEGVKTAMRRSKHDHV